MIVSQSQAIDILNNNGVVALPTETVYGLASRFDSEAALLQVFKIKQRPSFDPLIVHISNKKQLSVLTTSLQPVEEFLMNLFWPGPLTFVLPKSQNVSPIISSGLNSVAVRMPENTVFRNIIEQTAPLAAPSANMFGHTSPTTAAHVEREFSSTLPVVDGGSSQVGIESTVMEVKETSLAVQLHIHRPGMITESHLKHALTKYTQKEITVSHGATPASPGHIADHYQPRKPLVVIKKETPTNSLCFDLMKESLNIPPTSTPALLNYSEKDPTHVARILYSDLHRLSEDPHSQFILMTVPDDFLKDSWTALRDRIGKASTLSITSKDGSFFTHKKLKNFQ